MHRSSECDNCIVTNRNCLLYMTTACSVLAEGVTEGDATDKTKLPSNKKRSVKVDLKVKVLPKKKAGRSSEPPSKMSLSKQS